MVTSYTNRSAISATSFDTRAAGGDPQTWAESGASWDNTNLSWNGLPSALAVTNRAEPSTSFTVRISP